MAAYTIRALTHMYRSGFEYKKAAVMLSESQPEGQRQACLWDDAADEAARERSYRLMGVLGAFLTRSTLGLAVGRCNLEQ